MVYFLFPHSITPCLQPLLDVENSDVCFLLAILMWPVVDTILPVGRRDNILGILPDDFGNLSKTPASIVANESVSVPS